MSRSSRTSRDADFESPSFFHFRGNADPLLRSRLARRTTVGEPSDKAMEGEVHDRSLEREYAYSLQERDLKALGDIGAFRALELGDLALHRYHGDFIAAQKSVGHLSHAGLVRSRIT